MASQPPIRIFLRKPPRINFDQSDPPPEFPRLFSKRKFQHAKLEVQPLTLALSPKGERGQFQASTSSQHRMIKLPQPPFSPSGEKVAGGRMRGLLRFSENRKLITQNKPPSP
jgi:hypothetical protein